MANADALHIGENSPEQVAFKRILDTYAECIIAIRAPQNRDRGRGG
jgi:hypothetical protein